MKGREARRPEPAPGPMKSLAARLGGGVYRTVCAAGAGLSDAVWPRSCAGCGASLATHEPGLCRECGGHLEGLRQVSYCARCGRSMPPSSRRRRSCARCAHESYWNVAGIVRVGAYDPPLRQLILGLKYASKRGHADVVARLLAERLRGTSWIDDIEAFVPVPMHWLRRRQRPCDHARVLAESVSVHLGTPVKRVVHRATYTPSQTSQSRAERFRNVAGCFAVTPSGRRWLPGRTVCILDNLLTTGATVHELSKELRRAGARRIYAAVIARTTLTDEARGQPQPVKEPGADARGPGDGAAVASDVSPRTILA